MTNYTIPRRDFLRGRDHRRRCRLWQTGDTRRPPKLRGWRRSPRVLPADTILKNAKVSRHADFDRGYDRDYGERIRSRPRRHDDGPTASTTRVTDLNGTVAQPHRQPRPWTRRRAQHVPGAQSRALDPRHPGPDCRLPAARSPASGS